MTNRDPAVHAFAPKPRSRLRRARCGETGENVGVVGARLGDALPSLLAKPLRIKLGIPDDMRGLTLRVIIDAGQFEGYQMLAAWRWSSTSHRRARTQTKSPTTGGSAIPPSEYVSVIG